MPQLSHTELNTKLVECFGELEQLYNQIFPPSHGVTAYINEMESIALRDNISHSEWNYVLNKLKSVRHKRNKLSHGEISFYEPYAEITDIHFIKDFRMQILECTDPLAMLRKQESALPDLKPTLGQKSASEEHSTKTETVSNIITAILSFSLTILMALLVYYIYIYLRRYF